MGMRPNMPNMGPMYSMQQMQQMQMQMQQMQMRPGMMGKGMMGMPGQKGMPKGMGQPMRPQQQPMNVSSAIASAPPGMQKQMIGEKLYSIIGRQKPDLAGKITGMMLEMDNSELLTLLDHPDQMAAKVEEACRVLQGQ